MDIRFVSAEYNSNPFSSDENNSEPVSKTGGEIFRSRRGLVLVFICSFVLLFVEMVQPKIFQFVKFYGHELAVVGIAMLGIGLGGLASYVFGRYSERWVMVFSLLLPVTVLSSFFISALIFNYVLVILFSAAFYFTASVIISVHFIGYSSYRVYFANLLGSGLGIVAVYWFLPLLGGEGCMFFAAVIAALGSLIYIGLRRRAAIYSLILIILTLGIFIFQEFTDRFNLVWLVPLESKNLPDPNSVASTALKSPGNRLLASEWNLISRIDVLETPGYTMGDIFLPEGEKAIKNPNYLREFMESSSSTYHIYSNNNVFTSLAPAEKIYSHSPPYMFLDKPRVLVIGVGGGTDLAKALYHNPSRLVGVEINPKTAEMMAGKFASLSHNVYSQAEIEIMDGRTYVHYSKDNFDLINLFFADLYIPFLNSNIFMENYLYTVEAMRDYYRILSPNGYLAVTKWVGSLESPSELMRITATMLKALEEENVSSPADHLVIAGFNASGWDVYGGMVILKKKPFTAAEVEAIREFTVDPFFELHLPGGGGDT